MNFFDRLMNLIQPVEQEEKITFLPKLSHNNVEGYGALFSVDYAACEQTKARSMSSLPVTIVNKRNGKRENLTNHPLAKLLNGMVNECMSISDLMDWTTLRRDTFGNAFWFIEWNSGKPVAIYPINSNVDVTYKPENPRGYRVVFSVSPGDSFVKSGNYFEHEVVNIKTAISKDGIYGISLAKLASEEIGLSIELEQFYKSMLKNGNHQLGHVELPNERLTPEQVESLKTAVRHKSGVDHAGEAPILGYGAKWVTDQQTMKDASVIEQQEWVLRQVCRACNVPPWKVYETQGVSYSGGQQARIDYVADTIVPDVRKIELALKPVLVACGLPDAQVKFTVQGLMRGDDASRSAFYRELGYIGALTRADIRALEDMEPVDGLEASLFPLNYGTVNPDGTVNVFTSEQTPADGTQIKE